MDRSILSPEPVIQTNFRGTFTLLDAARRNSSPALSTSPQTKFMAAWSRHSRPPRIPLNPSSPYSASKAGVDLLARSYFVTYKLPVMITRA